jgi:hypothetical protein
LVDGFTTKITSPPGALVLVYPSAVDLSSRTLQRLAGLLAGHRRRIGSRWRHLTCGRQVLLVLAHLRCGGTYARLAAGLRIGIATVYCYIREAVDLLALLAATLEQAMDTVRSKAYVILDGTLLPVDRIAADRPYCSGKKKHHGMNVQVLADPAGRLIWASDALPGATRDLTAARSHDIPATLAAENTKCWADKAYQGASPTIRVPFRAGTCAAGAGVTTGTMPRSAASANAPWRSSRAGGSCASSAAAPPGSPPSPAPSSPSNSPTDQDGNGSLQACQASRAPRNLAYRARAR